jgi:hypothetical protein
MTASANAPLNRSGLSKVPDLVGRKDAGADSMIDENERDALFGTLHELAEMPRDQLKRQKSQSTLAIVKRLLLCCWVNKSFPRDMSPDEFADFVYQLREEERVWSSKLGGLIVAAEDKMAAGDSSSTKEYFDYFLARCPLKSLREIALIERASFLGE